MKLPGAKMLFDSAALAVINLEPIFIAQSAALAGLFPPCYVNFTPNKQSIPAKNFLA